MAITGARAAGAQEVGEAESLDRMRAKLEKPGSALKLQPRTPDFTVHIEKRRPMADIFDVPPWATNPVGWQPPGLGFDLLSVFRSAAKSVAEAKRGRDERLAREDVQRAIGDYCAAQTVEPRSRAADQMCSTSPAIR
jgi:hypothetical protein